MYYTCNAYVGYIHMYYMWNICYIISTHVLQVHELHV